MIYFSCVMATLRSEGVVEMLEFEAANTAGHVSDTFFNFERMVTGNSEEAVEFREKYSGADIYRDGQLRCSLTWPSEAEEKERQALEALNRALDIVATAAEKHRHYADALAKATAAKDELDAAQRDIDRIEADRIEARAAAAKKAAKAAKPK